LTSMYRGKKVLIIGGTGTIGQQLLKRILQEEPAVIRIFSRDEFKQFEMQQQWGAQSNIRYLIGDVRDSQRVLRAMEGVDYVFHTAAMKHVPSCEYNPFEAVQTNVIGTQNVIQAAITCDVKKVLFTSTDKAISPTNAYGATKLTAERLISATQNHKGSKPTIFSSVRFGNVMGSRGSVIPLFINQILEHRRITVTDSSMIRYMMTPSQAISLMLKANEISHGGEVFVLKMPIVRLSDLVEVLIEEVSRKYNLSDTVEVKSIGLRPGEKMYEELMMDDEYRIGYEMPDMYIVPSHFAEEKVEYSGAHKIENAGHRMDLEPTIDKETLRNWLIEESLI
jgi:UDP-N-acetylglucosamine 4,6-dehydratase